MDAVFNRIIVWTISSVRVKMEAITCCIVVFSYAQVADGAFVVLVGVLHNTPKLVAPLACHASRFINNVVVFFLFGDTDTPFRIATSEIVDFNRTIFVRFPPSRLFAIYNGTAAKSFQTIVLVEGGSKWGQRIDSVHHGTCS